MVRRMNCTFKQIYTTEEVDTQDRSDYQARLYKVLDVGARAIYLYLPFASQAICSQCAGVLFLVAEAPPFPLPWTFYVTYCIIGLIVP
jgi:hypothetical protein